MTLILASGSDYRRSLLERAGIDAVAMPSGFDERSLDGHLAEWGVDRYVVEVAAGKVREVADRVPDGAIVVGADQVAVLDGRLLTKPGTVEVAVRHLVAMAGRSHELVNGIVVARVGGRSVSAVDRHVVTMRAFTEAEARAYVEAYRPLDCVGAYRIEDDAGLIDSVVGSGDDGVIGLPISLTLELIDQVGGP